MQTPPEVDLVSVREQGRSVLRPYAGRAFGR
jgi:hypothetical protein